MNITKPIRGILTIIAMSAAAGLARGQTADLTNGIPGFFSTVTQWSTSFNTNLTWTNSTIELYTGTVNNNNQNMEAIFGVRVNPWQGSEVGVEMNNVSALGTISQYAGVVGWGFDHYDMRISLEAAVGYRPLDQVGIAIPRVAVEKLMTGNTSVKLVLGMPIPFKGKGYGAPDVSVQATAIVW